MSRRNSLKDEACVYYCPHGEDKIHSDKAGCPFQGSLSALYDHLEVCKYEAAEVRGLADHMACYLRKNPKCATEVASIAKSAIDRLAKKDLDERRVEISDTVQREIVVKGLEVQPMLKRFAKVSKTQKNSVKDAWQEFLRYCLPGFQPVQLPLPRLEGGRLMEDMLQAQLRDVEDKAHEVCFSQDQHSYRVWSLAIQAAVSAAAVSLEMEPGLVDGVFQTSTQQSHDIGTAKILESAGIGHGGGDLMKVLKIFKQWDIDHNGSISKEELFALLTSLDNKMTQADADRLISAADMNHDNCIDYAEFVAWLLK